MKRISPLCVGRRLISISLGPQPVSTVRTLDQTATVDTNIQNVQKLLYETTLDSPQLTTLGTPPNVLSVSVPPSVPVHLKKGSLLSLYNCRDIDSELRITHHLFKPWKSIQYLQWPFGIYSRLISTTPFSVLVSSGSKLHSFATVTLDGSTDWAVLKPKALGAYIGNTLSVSLFRYPRTISRKLAGVLPESYTIKSKTGFSPWRGYTFLTGRGHVGLVGEGSIYNINLEAGEKILIHLKNLLAITVNGPYDLQNCIAQYTKKATNENAPTASASSETSTEVAVASSDVTSSEKETVQPWYWKAFNSVKSLFSKAPKAESFLVGREQFVTVVGPRNLLMQSSYGTLLSAAVETTNKLKIPANKAVQGVKKTLRDVLSYVTIRPSKGAVFENTDNFKESVEKIEKKA